MSKNKTNIKMNSTLNKEKNIINKEYVYAIVGASRNKDKYGFKVLKQLNNAGFKVVPINPHENHILGLKVYKTITQYVQDNGKIDVVVFVVPPAITEKILHEVKELKIKNVWMQPGSESQDSIKFCEQNNINCIHNACIMIKSQGQKND